MFSFVYVSKWVAFCTTASLGVGLATVMVPRAAIAFDSRLAENVTVQINGYSQPDDGFPGGSGVIVGGRRSLLGVDGVTRGLRSHSHARTD